MAVRAKQLNRGTFTRPDMSRQMGDILWESRIRGIVCRDVDAFYAQALFHVEQQRGLGDRPAHVHDPQAERMAEWIPDDLR
jgi:hypothetical protein